MLDTTYATFYRNLAVESAAKVAKLAKQYEENPDGDVWCSLENAQRQWVEYHNIWRAMRCHKL